jgi:hypothetical protein
MFEQSGGGRGGWASGSGVAEKQQNEKHVPAQKKTLGLVGFLN